MKASLRYKKLGYKASLFKVLVLVIGLTFSVYATFQVAKYMTRAVTNKSVSLKPATEQIVFSSNFDNLSDRCLGGFHSFLGDWVNQVSLTNTTSVDVYLLGCFNTATSSCSTPSGGQRCYLAFPATGLAYVALSESASGAYGNVLKSRNLLLSAGNYRLTVNTSGWPLSRGTANSNTLRIGIIDSADISFVVSQDFLTPTFVDLQSTPPVLRTINFTLVTSKTVNIVLYDVGANSTDGKGASVDDVTLTQVFPTPTPIPTPTPVPTIIPSPLPTASPTPVPSGDPCKQCSGMFSVPQSYCKLSCQSGTSCTWEQTTCIVNGVRCYQQICIGYPRPRD